MSRIARTSTRCALLALLLAVPACDDGGADPAADGTDVSLADTSSDGGSDAATGSDGSEPDGSGDLDVLDTTSTADVPDITDTANPDTSDGDSTDAPDVPDVIDDPELEGTALADVGVAWPDELALCTVWREQQSVEEERAAMLQLRFDRAQTRQGLGATAFADATLDGPILAATGPFAADRAWAPTPDVTSTLVEHEVSSVGAGIDLVTVSLDHEIAGLGTLREAWIVQRRQDEPVRHTAARSQEARWEFVPEGSATPTLLEPCDGHSELERAIQVITAEHTDGRTLVLLRHMATALTVAGSAPVSVTGHEVWPTDASWEARVAAGYFTRVYAAAHHNWFDTSHIELAHDPINWHLDFAPWATLEAPTIERVEFQGVDAFTTSDNLDVITRAVDGGTTTETWSATIRGRVDLDAMARIGAPCPEPSLMDTPTSLGRFHWATCPDPGAGGVAPFAMVPVVFHTDVELIGLPVDSVDSPSDGVFTASMRPAEGAETYTVTMDLSGGIGAELTIDYPDGSSASEFAALLPVEHPRAHLDAPPLAHRSADGNVGVTVHRITAGLGGGNTTLYVPRRVDLELDGEHVIVDGLDALEYEVKHHNHGDILTARWGGDGADGRVLTWVLGVAGDASVEIVDGTGATVLALTPLAAQ